MICIVDMLRRRKQSMQAFRWRNADVQEKKPIAEFCREIRQHLDEDEWHYVGPFFIMSHQELLYTSSLAALKYAYTLSVFKARL